MAGLPTDAAAALWDRVVARWDDDAVHEAFIDLCAASGQLPFAARCYREHGEAAEGESAGSVREVVERRLAAIQGKALATMQVQRQPVEARRGCRTALNLVAVGLFLLSLVLLALFLR